MAAGAQPLWTFLSCLPLFLVSSLERRKRGRKVGRDEERTQGKEMEEGRGGRDRRPEEEARQSREGGDGEEMDCGNERVEEENLGGV